jgi:hypothetical protein
MLTIKIIERFCVHDILVNMKMDWLNEPHYNLCKKIIDNKTHAQNQVTKILKVFQY